MPERTKTKGLKSLLETASQGDIPDENPLLRHRRIRNKNRQTPLSCDRLRLPPLRVRLFNLFRAKTYIMLYRMRHY